MLDPSIRIQDNLYEAVNGEWLKTAVIPEDKPMTGGFSTLEETVETIMMADFKALSEGEKSSDIPELKYAIALYRKMLDCEQRNREGIAPLLPLLNLLQSIKSPEDLNQHAVELLFQNVDLPIYISVTEDMQNSEQHAFILSGPDLILPDTPYYAEDNAAGKKLLETYSEMLARALTFTPLSEQEQKQYLKDTLAYDALIAKKVKSKLEWSEYFKNHNPMDTEQVSDFVAPFDLKRILNTLYGEQAPKTVIVYDPKAIREMKDYFSEKNFTLYIHWAYAKTLLKATEYLSEELATIGKRYSRALSGISADPSPEKQAYQLASKIYAEPVGVYYGRTYFGEEAKHDIVSIAKKIIDTYRLRMERNSFLTASTKAQAIKKLSTINVKMGYPDEIREIWSKLVFDESDSLYCVMTELNAINQKDQFEKLLKPVDRTEWVMPGHRVNACYNPSINDITFPAAILQKPFYSLSQSVSENLGGIGAVIAHEISHAFDNNGANFDEHGNLKNWWTEEDFNAFKELTQKMTRQFDGIEIHGGTVNGELVVSENIADNGGMGATLELLHTFPDPDFRAYFINWARIWCMKAKDEFLKLRLANDVHAPNILRANMPPRNFTEWYEAFSVTEQDQMYLPAEKRICIW